MLIYLTPYVERGSLIVHPGHFRLNTILRLGYVIPFGGVHPEDVKQILKWLIFESYRPSTHIETILE